MSAESTRAKSYSGPSLLKASVQSLVMTLQLISVFLFHIVLVFHVKFRSEEVQGLQKNSN